MKKFLPFLFFAFFINLLPILTFGRVRCIQGNCENGHETMIYDKGYTYAGEWKNGKYHGQGIQRNSDGSSYEGEWKAGKEHGQGTLTWSEAYKFVGEFKEGEKHGRGVEIIKGGETIKGYWVNNKYSGQEKPD